MDRLNKISIKDLPLKKNRLIEGKYRVDRAAVEPWIRSMWRHNPTKSIFPRGGSVGVALDAAHSPSPPDALLMSKQTTPDNETGAPSTLASAVFEKLRLDILEGHIPPGEKLRIEALRERYNVGASPLREALNRLTAMHLVEQVDQRGFRVPPVSLEEFDELSRTRCWVNEIAIREAIAHGDQAWEEEIVLAFHRLWRTPPVLEGEHLNREWELLHRRFHSALIAACPSKWLRNFHETLFDYADRHRHLHVRRVRSDEDTTREHREIMEAVVQRDEARAVQLLNEAILSLRPSLPAAAADAAPAEPAFVQGSAPAPAPRRARAKA